MMMMTGYEIKPTAGEKIFGQTRDSYLLHNGGCRANTELFIEEKGRKKTEKT